MQAAVCARNEVQRNATHQDVGTNAQVLMGAHCCEVLQVFLRTVSAPATAGWPLPEPGVAHAYSLRMRGGASASQGLASADGAPRSTPELPAQPLASSSAAVA
jgi:hypothetical protein